MTSVYRQLFDRLPSKAERRIVSLLEGTIRTYVAVGIENTNFDQVAKMCKVSRSLVQHYFKDKSELFTLVAKYIRVKFQQIAVEAIRGQSSPTKQLEAYVGSLFTWIRQSPLHAKVWSLAYYYAAVDPKFRKLHTELAEMGHQRIIALLSSGVDAGEFPSGDLATRAKLIQTLYTGGFIMVTSENLYVDLDMFRSHLVAGCFAIARSDLTG